MKSRNSQFKNQSIPAGFSAGHPLATWKPFVLATMVLCLSNCNLLTPSGGTGSSGTVLGGSAPGGFGIGNNQGSDDSGDQGVGGTSGGTGGGSALPPASIPAPALKKIIVPSADSSSYVPVVGYDEAVSLSGTDENGTSYQMTDSDNDGFVDNYYVVTSASSLENTSAQLEKTNKASAISSLLMGSALATSESIGAPVEKESDALTDDSAEAGSAEAEETGSAATATKTYCEGFNVADKTPYVNTDSFGSAYTCCGITTSGSFECFIPHADNDITAHIYVTDGQTLGKETQDVVNTSFLYLRQDPTDVVAGTLGLPTSINTINDLGVFFSLAKNSIVPIKQDDGVFTVIGHPEKNYEAAETDASELAYNSSKLQFAGRVTADGISHSSFNPISLFDPLKDSFLGWAESSVDAESYTAIKVVGQGINARTLFGVKNHHDSQDFGRLYNLDDKDITEVEFVKSSEDNGSITHKQTLAFDIEDGVAEMSVVLFEDESNQYRFRAVLPSLEEKFGGEEVLLSGDGYNFSSVGENATEFGDMFIYYSQPDPVQEGRALLLDKTNSVVWMPTYYFNPRSYSSSYVVSQTSPTLTLAQNGIAVGHNPTSMVLNHNKTKAYVLCSDNKVYVLDLFNANNGPYAAADVPVSTIPLADYIEKEISYTPEQISYQKTALGEEFLMVTLKDMRSNLVISL